MTPRRLAFGYGAGLALASLASWVRVGLSGSFRIDTKAPAFFVSSALLGVGLAVASASALRLTKAAEDVPARQLLRWALIANLAAIVAAPLTSRDLFHYLLTGSLQLLGKNPFAVPLREAGTGPLFALAAPQWLDDATVYGPLAALLFRGAAWVGQQLGSPVWGNAIAFKLTMAACDLAFIVIAARYLFAHEPRPGARRTLAIVAYSPLIAWEVMGQAHNDGVVLVALMVFAAAATDRREVTAAAAVTAASLVKIALLPVLALYLLFLLRVRRATRPAIVVLATTTLLVLPYLKGYTGMGPVLTALAHSAQSHSVGDFLYNVLAPCGPGVQELAVRMSLIVCVGLCAVAFFHALRALTARDHLRRALVFLLVWDMTTPLFQPWYVTWLYPFAVVEADPRWQRLIGVYGICTVLTWALPIDPFTTMVVNGYVIVQMVRLQKPLATSDITFSADREVPS